MPVYPIRFFAFLCLLVFAMPANAQAPVIHQNADGIAIKGFDVMSYWRGGEPVEGDRAISHRFDGATWLFSSTENRDAFAAEPRKYAPQYGGYCAYAASKGSVAGTDPTAWTLHNNKLYLNYSKQVRTIWAGDMEENITNADVIWPGPLE